MYSLEGKCYYCKKEFSKSGILKHIKSCSVRKEYMGESTMASKAKKNKFILSIASKYEPSVYWLYIAIDKTATLKELDKFLRDIWVECCGHLSSFEINGVSYESSLNDCWGWKNSAKNMDVKLKDVVVLNDKINYEYDFGSTTYLNIKVAGELSSSSTENKIEIMARNNEPEIKCSNCGDKAAYYDYDHEEYLCEECLKDITQEDSEMIEELEYCNSPRDGVCGYWGKKENEEAYLPVINNQHVDIKQINNSKNKNEVHNIHNDKDANKDNVIDINEILKAKNQNKLMDINNLLDFEDEEELENNLIESMENLFKDFIISKGISMEKKIWSSMKNDTSLEYHLGRLTKKELVSVANNLNIKKVSSLKKEQLKNKILGLYEEKIDIYIENLDTSRFNFLLNLAIKEGGIYENMEDDDLVETYFFRERALVFPGIIDKREVVIMPDEARKILLNKNTEDFKNKLLKNEEIIKLFWGMCYYYGVIELEQFTKLVTKYIDYDIDDMDLVSILGEAAVYYNEFYFDGYLGTDALVEDEYFILSQQKNRDDLDFYPFTKKELFKVAVINYEENGRAYKKFYSYLCDNFNIDSDKAEDLIFNLEIDIQNTKDFSGGFSDFLECFNFTDMDEANEMLNELRKFANSIRQWAIKGYTPNELVALEKGKRQNGKIGRNEPCPCGSGKKYKNCCLKK